MPRDDSPDTRMVQLDFECAHIPVMRVNSHFHYHLRKKLPQEPFRKAPYAFLHPEQSTVALKGMNWEDAALSIAKWAVTAIGGGLIFKTIIEKSGERKRRNRMRRQLYEGILLNYESFLERIRVATSTEGIKQGTPFRFKEKLNLYFAAWENYSSQANKEFLYTVDEAATIQNIFESFEAINFVSDENPYELLHTAREAVASVDEAILQGKLDKDLLKEVAALSVWNFVSELIEGRRKSYKATLNPF